MESSILTNVNNSWWKFKLIDKSEPHYDLKIAIWLYFFLWIFEGALRKWFLPFLATPLLIVRDPVALWLIILSVRHGILKFNIYLFGMILLGILGFFTTIFFGHGNVGVALYGLRPFLLCFPMIFIIGRVLNMNDVIKIGKVVLIISLPMAMLLGIQFYSQQSAWVNRGIGGDESGSGFGGVMGYFRPSATFSFTNGTTYFFTLVGSFLMFFLLNSKFLNKFILFGSVIALLISIPFSISRGLLIQVLLSLFFMIIAVVHKPKYLKKILVSIFIISIFLSLASNISFFKTATEVFTTRFESANEEEGGLVQGVLLDRVLGQLMRSIMGSADQSVFGFGIGSGSSLGAKLLNDYSILQLADFEWMRQIGEYGLMGLFVITIRLGVTYKISFASYCQMRKNNILSWMLMSLGILILSIGGLHQPTAEGFYALVGGFWLSSLKNTNQVK